MTERFDALLDSAQKGDRQAKETLLTENSGLIWSIARRFFGRGVEAEDLFQLGSLGFLKAVQGFDRSYGTCFSTYAVPKISGEIRRFLRDDGAIKVSRTIKERAAAIKAARKKLSDTLYREPTVNELSQALGLTPEEIASAETATASAESIQRETGEDGFTLEAVLTDGNMEETVLERVGLREALEKLSERERQVISLRYFHDLTQDRAARILGVSQVQVSRLERKALGHLREII